MHQPNYEIVQKKIEEIVEELKSLNYWQAEPLPPASYNFQNAFGSDTMTFKQWLQFIFVPRVQIIIEKKGKLPGKSVLGEKAFVEYEKNSFYPEAEHLVKLLEQFDDLVNVGTPE